MSHLHLIGANREAIYTQNVTDTCVNEGDLQHGPYDETGGHNVHAGIATTLQVAALDAEDDSILSIGRSSPSIDLANYDTPVRLYGNLLDYNGYITLNTGNQDAITPYPGGVVVNYLAVSAPETCLATGDFTAGAAPATLAQVTTDNTIAFNPGDFIMIIGSNSNDGLYEVLLDAAGVIQIATTVAGSPPVYDFCRDDFISETGQTTATITKVNVSVLRAGIDGLWEAGLGSDSTLVFTDILGATLDDAYEAGPEISINDGNGPVRITLEPLSVNVSGIRFEDFMQCEFENAESQQWILTVVDDAQDYFKIYGPDAVGDGVNADAFKTFTGNGAAGAGVAQGGVGGYYQIELGDGGAGTGLFDGGEGGYIDIDSGIGGDAPSGQNPGNGGRMSINLGKGGDGGGAGFVAGDGGWFIYQAGNGGIPSPADLNVGGNGGYFQVTGGTGGTGPVGFSGTGGNGGNVNFYGGDGGDNGMGGTGAAGDGGNVNIMAGNGGFGTAHGTAGAVNIDAGTNPAPTQGRINIGTTNGLFITLGNNFGTGSATHVYGYSFEGSTSNFTAFTCATMSIWSQSGAADSIVIESQGAGGGIDITGDTGGIDVVTSNEAGSLTGNINVGTGNSGAAASGDLVLRTGTTVDTASGKVQIYTGNPSGTGNSGELDFYTGAPGGSGASGRARLYSGDATGNSGLVSIFSGVSAATSGTVYINSGVSSSAAAGVSGNIDVRTGNVTAGTGNSGSIVFVTGTSVGGVRGDFWTDSLNCIIDTDVDFDLDATHDVLIDADNSFSIDGNVASNVTVTNANLTLSTATAGDIYVQTDDGDIYVQTDGDSQIFLRPKVGVGGDVFIGQDTDTGINRLTIYDGGGDFDAAEIVMYDQTGVAHVLWVDQAGDLRIEHGVTTKSSDSGVGTVRIADQ